MDNDANQITNVMDLLERIETIYCNLKQGSCRPLFFRGHADKDWTLIPHVMRAPLFHERSLILDYKQVFDLTPDYFDKLESILATMQHHEIPTRLLDWSISPLQALYFACSNEKKIHNNGELIVINPWSIFQTAFNQPYRPTYHYELMKRARLFLALGWTVEEISEHMQRQNGYRIHSKELNEPLPIVGRYLDRRVSDQQGMFLLWGTDKISLDFQPSYKNQIQRFVIPAKSKPTILSQLSRLGINDFTSFRDLEGFKKAINKTGSIFNIITNNL